MQTLAIPHVGDMKKTAMLSTGSPSHTVFIITSHGQYIFNKIFHILEIKMIVYCKNLKLWYM